MLNYRRVIFPQNMQSLAGWFGIKRGDTPSTIGVVRFHDVPYPIINSWLRHLAGYLRLAHLFGVISYLHYSPLFIIIRYH